MNIKTGTTRPEKHGVLQMKGKAPQGEEGPLVPMYFMLPLALPLPRFVSAAMLSRCLENSNKGQKYVIFFRYPYF